MPTYNVHYPQGLLNATQKQTIAKRITETHSAVTGAQQFFAQVLFREIPGENWYLAGEPLTGPHLFLFGHIRAGRTLETKAKLLRALRDVLVEHGDVSIERAWVYLSDVPAAHIIEYGDILPDPGQEEQWLANLPEAARKLLSNPSKS
ncbi:tautomerase family protein [Burkholderia multivorans]|uniref:tautomerase family protein n=1 Tax=Burkholderia multivorans TaxID=87883 RepID=UPI001C2396B8|nr:tautomerase family protein [Burkholderia multivorans]MBU9477059.1 tautomerase family protein [Burkholderia multivorans]